MTVVPIFQILQKNGKKKRRNRFQTSIRSSTNSVRATKISEIVINRRVAVNAAKKNCRECEALTNAKNTYA